MASIVCRVIYLPKRAYLVHRRRKFASDYLLYWHRVSLFDQFSRHFPLAKMASSGGCNSATYNIIQLVIKCTVTAPATFSSNDDVKKCHRDILIYHLFRLIIRLYELPRLPFPYGCLSHKRIPHKSVYTYSKGGNPWQSF